MSYESDELRAIEDRIANFEPKTEEEWYRIITGIEPIDPALKGNMFAPRDEKHPV